MEQNGENKSLSMEEFNWEGSSGPSFFGIEGEKAAMPLSTDEEDEEPFVVGNATPKETKEVPKPAKKKEDKGTEGEAKENEEDEEPEVNLFGDNQTPEGTEGEQGGEQEDSYYATLAKQMKEKGVFKHVEIEDDAEINEDRFLELQEEESEGRATEIVKDLFADFDDDTQAFIRFKQAGGSTQQFFATYQEGSILTGLNPDNEADQVSFLRQHYLKEGIEPEDIDGKIDWHKENGNTKKYFDKYYNVAKIKDEAKKEKLEQDALDRENTIKKNRAQYLADMTAKVVQSKEVKGIPLTKEDHRQLGDYIAKPAFKIANNRFISTFQKDLNDALQDQETTIAIAKLLKSKFDLSSVKTKAETRQSKSIKEEIEKSRSGSKRPFSTGGGVSARTLADFLES